MKHLLLITIAAVLLVVAEEGNAYALDFVKTEFKAPSGNVLRYAIMKPEKVKTEETYPLVISLHGSGGRGIITGNVIATQTWHSANRKGENNTLATLLHRQSKRASAGMVKRSRPLFELISSLQTKHDIDPDRIYVTGQSMGGYGTFAAITLRPKLFAAAAPVCGGGQTELAKQIAQIPIWVFHGAKIPPCQWSVAGKWLKL